VISAQIHASTDLLPSMNPGTTEEEAGWASK